MDFVFFIFYIVINFFMHNRFVKFKLYAIVYKFMQEDSGFIYTL